MVTGVVAVLRPKLWMAQSLEWTIQLINAERQYDTNICGELKMQVQQSVFVIWGKQWPFLFCVPVENLICLLAICRNFSVPRLYICYFNSNMVLGHYPNPRHLYMLYVQICASNVYIYILYDVIYNLLFSLQCDTEMISYNII